MESLEFWEKKKAQNNSLEGYVVPEEQMYALLIPAMERVQDDIRRCYIGLWMNLMSYRRLPYVTMTEGDIDILYGIARELAEPAQAETDAEVIELGRLSA